jgi:hypothetical protein
VDWYVVTSVVLLVDTSQIFSDEIAVERQQLFQQGISQSMNKFLVMLLLYAFISIVIGNRNIWWYERLNQGFKALAHGLGILLSIRRK